MKTITQFWLILSLLLMTVGCERKLTKPSESAEQTQSLHKAASDGDIEQVKMLISKGVDVNAKDEKENTPLCYAVKSGKMKVVQLLIEAGADVNAGPWPPLCEAVDANNIAIAEYLIAHGADVNAGDDWNALQQAPYASSIQMVELLIAKGANVNAGPFTALHGAVNKGRRDVAELLIRKGADINAKDNRGRTPLHLVLDVDRFYYKLFKDIAELLIAKGADVSSKDEYGRTPLHLAATFNQKDIVELLLAKGTELNEKDDKYGFTALHYAARFGNKDVAEFLTDKGANINAKDNEGHTPLCIAVKHDYKVAELLINKGADGNIKTESGQTLFQLAQERKSIESTVPDKIFDGDPNSLFGSTVSCGDIDNDGYDDIIVGAPYYNNDRGRAYLYWGSKRDSMDVNPDKIFDGKAEENACFSFSYPGPVIYDIDNDGYRDVIFGAYPYRGKGIGQAYLYYGNKKELMDTSYDLIFTAENKGDHFGFIIGCGDVDNDDYGDILIGARLFPSDNLRQGRAYLYYGGNRSNIDAKADKIFDAESKDRHYFGQGIICIDQNKDGFDDILIGAQGYQDRQGRVYLFYGDTRANLDSAADKTFDGEMEHSDYGFVIMCGDIDGDDNSDIVIGADFIRQKTGRVYVYWGSELSSPSPKPGRIFTGENRAEMFSQGLACGDVNNDGFDDLIIGAHGYKEGSEQGRAYLYYGGPRGNR